MNSKKYLALIVGCGIALLMAIGAAVLLVLSISSHGKSEAELKTAMNRLEQLNRRKPFPAQENVAAAQSNLVALKKTLGDVQQTLSHGQIEPDDIERAEFGPMLERTVKRLRSTAVANHVALPEKFAFGFDRYSAGDLPQTSSVRRLVTQLKTISAVCDLVYAAKVTNLLSVTREEFETQSAGGAAGSESAPASLFGARVSAPSAPTSINLKEVPVVASNELYSTERIGLQFAGRENAVFEVLNAFAKAAPFTVVRDVTLESVTLGQKAGESKQANPFGGQAEAAGGSGASTNLLVAHEDRIVAGREDVKATVVLDVFRFAKEQGEAK